jgi:hypothetical protein
MSVVSGTCFELLSREKEIVEGDKLRLRMML